MVDAVLDWYVPFKVQKKLNQPVTVVQPSAEYGYLNAVRTIQFQDETSVSEARFKYRVERIAESSNYKLHQEHLLNEYSLLAAKWKALVLDPSAGCKSKDLIKTTEPVFEALLKFGPSAIDLRDLQEEMVNGAHLAVVLRATFTRRTEVPGWSRALQIAKKNLESSGANVKSVLGGLI
jgi:hypothetical protein